MALNLYATDIPELVVQREYDLTFPQDGFKEHCLELNHKQVKGFYKEILFDGVHIGYGNLALAQKTLIQFDTDYESIEMHFALNGSTIAVSERMQHEVVFRPNQHNIIYANNFRGKMEWSGNDFQVFEINMTPDFFNQYLPEDSLIFELFKHNIVEGNSALISQQNNLINLQMFQIIQDIIHCERKGLFKKMFLEAKVIELLLLQLEQICSENFTNSTVKKTEIEKIYAVRDYILDNLTHNCSLIDLAHKVGTNEFTLKKGFKELFGTTVFGFWNDAKMEEAKKMLQSKQLSVGEVADVIGYKNPQHFTAAFKRKYGIVPSRI